MEKNAIIVLGMHRSGTSALAAVISMLGITPGSKLLQPVAEVNPLGFWEHQDIVALHDQMLEALGSSWHDDRPLQGHIWSSLEVNSFRQKIVAILRRDFSAESIWLIKDPRMCRLLPLWRDVFLELACHPKFILVLRHPAEVANSIRMRDGLPEELASLLWLGHMLEAEYQTRDQQRVFISYSRLLEEWQQIVASIGETLGIVWPISIEEASASITAFLDPGLRHYANDNTLPDHPACQLALKGFELLSETSPDPFELDRLRTQTAPLVKLIGPWSKQLHRSAFQVRKLSPFEMESAMLHSEISRIKSTFSWQITKPLRLAATIAMLLWNICPGKRRVNQGLQDR
jgi:hypothetical protein